MVRDWPIETIEEFDRRVALPENADKLFEYIGGTIVEVVSNNRSSNIGSNALGEIKMFIKGKNLGYVTGADGGYIVSGERYIPDAAFISKARQAEPSREAYNPLPPDLAVEVLSPSNTQQEIRIKIVNYLLAGTTVWLFDPDQMQAEIYTPGKPVMRLGINDTLEGGDVLPGFAVPLREIFAD